MVIFLANYRALIKPSDINIFSHIILLSGTTIVIGLNKAFRLSGNSDLPSYPGFIVINIPNVNIIFIF